MRFFTETRLSENIHETPEGFLICYGVPIARTGDMVYAAGETPIEPGPDGTVIVTRDASEVFNPKTVASFEGKSFTVWHPSDFINPKNWRELTRGILFHVRRGTGDTENDLLADILVSDASAIEKVKAGMREVSLGYDADYVQTGVGRGVQKNIIGNHCALVDEGRAGAKYAINDHKGKGSTMKLRDRIKSIFGKAQDDALKLVEDAELNGTEDGDDEGESAPTNDAVMKTLDKLEKKIDALGKKGKTRDKGTEASGSEPAREKAKDDEGAGAEGGMAALEARLTKVESLLSKLAEKMSMAAADEDGEGDDDKVTDEDGDDDDEVTDDDFEKSTMTGDRKNGPDDDDEDEEDVASRVEILAPGMNARVKDAKRKALIAAYQTKDGKKVIERFTKGKKPDFKNKKFVETVFIAASELLADDRTSDFGRSKVSDYQAKKDPAASGMSPEALNKANEAHYKTQH